MGYIEMDDEGVFEEGAIHTLLRATAAGLESKFTGQCYYCKRSDPGWTRCFTLREIFVKNGMKPYKPTTAPCRTDAQPAKPMATGIKTQPDAKASN